jgi:hypothetical protein
MKILILSIYSNNSPHYEKMLEIQRKYVHNYENVDYYFVQSNFQHNENVFIEKDMIHVKESENHFTILNKSLQSMKTLFNLCRKDYDFVIRTNVSTLIDIPKLLELLTPYKYNPKLDLNNVVSNSKIEYLYAGSICGIYGRECCYKIEKPSKFYDEHINFALGISIIMSKQLVKSMITQINNFNHNLPDDVAIGLFVEQYFPKARVNDLSTDPFTFHTRNLANGWNSTLDDFITYINNNDNKQPFIFYRNKTNNRQEDIKIMSYICDNILLK